MDWRIGEGKIENWRIGKGGKISWKIQRTTYDFAKDSIAVHQIAWHLWSYVEIELTIWRGCMTRYFGKVESQHLVSFHTPTTCRASLYTLGSPACKCQSFKLGHGMKNANIPLSSPPTVTHITKPPSLLLPRWRVVF